MIVGKYNIVSKIGEGKFGSVFLGERRSNGDKLAIKIEIVDPLHELKLLKQETTILNYLYSRGCRNVPFVYWYGLHETAPTLVMTHYTQSLHDYIISQNYLIERPLIDRFIRNMVEILESVHEHFVIHRDIKPQNFMIKGQELVLIDFGLATIYVDNNKKHILAKNDKTSILGTPKFVSPNIHDGLEPSRRDDMISVGYIYLYLLSGGELPWQNIQLTSEQYENGCQNIYLENHILHPKNVERRRLKSWTSIMEFLEQLSKMNNNNSIMAVELFLKHIYNLKFDEKPMYKLYNNE